MLPRPGALSTPMDPPVVSSKPPSHLSIDAPLNFRWGRGEDRFSEFRPMGVQQVLPDQRELKLFGWPPADASIQREIRRHLRNCEPVGIAASEVQFNIMGERHR